MSASRILRHTERLVNLLRTASPDTPVFANAIPPETSPVPTAAFVYREAGAARPINFQGASRGGTTFRVQAHAADYGIAIAMTGAVEETADEIVPKAIITGSDSDYDEKRRLHIRELTVQVR